MEGFGGGVQMLDNGQAKVSLKNLGKRFGDVVAVDRVTLEVYEGEFLTLLGPSGSGKTTTLMMIAGFEFPTEGEISIGGRDISGVPPSKRNIGMVFQNYALFPHMTVYDNIAFPLKMRKYNKTLISERVRAVLEKVKLPGFERRYPKQLSGGQQQRVALARALVFDPPVLLMDEPLGALDKKLREYMQIEIKNIQRDLKITTVYVTHDQAEALTMSNRIAVFNEGRVEQIGPPEEIYDRPANKFVADFIGETNFLEGSITGTADNGYHFKSVGGCEFLLAKKDIPIGSKVTIAIRPEKIAVLTERVRGFNHLEGIVEEVIYVGETRRYRIRLNDNESIFVKQQTYFETRSVKRSDRVLIGWPIHGTQIL
jgi:spermidine/putrescine ABC transporter ATP-binding subunit